MLDSIFSLFIAIFSAFLPILLWGYAFSYLDSDSFNARRFFLGVASGAAAVFPIAYMPELINALSLGGNNVFSHIATKTFTTDGVVSFFAFLGMVAVTVFLVGFLLRSSEIFQNFRPYFRSLLAVILLIPIFWGLLWILPQILPQDTREIRIAGAVLSGFSSIILAYFVVASVEEGGKHLGLFSAASGESLASRASLYAVFGALGFAFAENSLYLFALLRPESNGGAYFSTWFSRSLFSVVVHVLCSVVAAAPLLQSMKSENSGFSALSAVILGLLFSIVLHSTFDVSISYGKTGIIFLYLIFAYTYVTRAFARGRAL